MCGIWQKYKKNPEDRKGEMSSEEIVRAIADSKLIKKIDKIGISGGEPFLKENFTYLLSSIFKIPQIHSINLNTNGLLSDEINSIIEQILNKMPHHKNLSVTISIDGVGSTDDRIRGMPGHIERATKTTDLLLHLAQKYAQLHIDICAVIQPANIDNLVELEKFCDTKNLNLGYLLLMRSYIVEKIGDPYHIGLLSSSQIDEIKEIGTRKKMIGLRKLLTDRKRPLRCYAGYSSMYIDPYGDLYPCCNIANNDTFLMGNIKKASIDKIWMSPQAWMVQKRVKKCKRVECWGGCELNAITEQHSLLEKAIRILTRSRLDYYRLRGLR